MPLAIVKTSAGFSLEDPRCDKRSRHHDNLDDFQIYPTHRLRPCHPDRTALKFARSFFAEESLGVVEKQRFGPQNDFPVNVASQWQSWGHRV